MARLRIVLLLAALGTLQGGCSHWLDCIGGTDVEVPCYCKRNSEYHGVCPPGQGDRK